MPFSPASAADVNENGPLGQYSPQPNLLERRAADYLARRRAVAHRRDGKVTDGGSATIRRRAIAFAVMSGIISGSLIGGSEVFVRQSLLGGMEDDIGFWQQLPYWAAFLGFAGIVSAVEIIALYWIALDSAVKINRIDGGALGDRDTELVERGLARAALEFPNPDIRVYGIDPYAYMPRWRLTAHNIGYRLKVGVSSFVLRLFMRRVVGRLVVRSLIPLLSGPLYAAWNAWIVWRIDKELRIRSLGPVAVEHLMRELAGATPAENSDAMEIVLHGTGELMMRACDAHPNYVLLLTRLKEHLGRKSDLTVDWPTQRRQLRQMPRAKQETVLGALTVAAALAGKVTRNQQEFLRECHRDAGVPFRADAASRLREQIIAGKPDAVARHPIDSG